MGSVRESTRSKVRELISQHQRLVNCIRKDQMTFYPTPKLATNAVPIAFMAAGAWCFGWFYPARLPALKVGVVLCSPIGYEAVCAAPNLYTAGGSATEAGLPVVDSIIHGTGDSAGGDADPDRVHAWIAAASLKPSMNWKRLGNVLR
jgi:hypothetical protein